MFAVDPRRALALSEFDAALSDERAAAAHVLADLCVSFIYFHEFGDILCGHADAASHLLGQAQLVEFASRRAARASHHHGLQQYWGYPADAVAAMLLPQYIERLPHAMKRKSLGDA